MQTSNNTEEYPTLYRATCFVCKEVVHMYHTDHMIQCVHNNIYKSNGSINPIIIQYYVFLYVFGHMSLSISEFNSDILDSDKRAVNFAKKLYTALYEYRINKRRIYIKWPGQNYFVFAALYTLKNKRECNLQIWPGFTKETFESFIPRFKENIIYKSVMQ
jgi:hypothetical protein